ncbi:hypothetical protein [Mesorhizobium sp. L-8-3]|uniref:hypothetical protein n=1 Tax=Mesorhizobium sp. L-8-3 TaxID=2744522 RepID=UPI001927D393|nr:hypothetical protein [Mesorhizobium sp. L-8-3]BCH22499.1 hypothetical protein MesoLjLb_22840 [Mesorhizobium sp. L-8-3]
MVRVLVTAIMSILLYNTISFIYVLFSDPKSLHEYYMSREFRELNEEINWRLSLKRSVNISDIFNDAEEACLTDIDVDPLEIVEKRGIKDVDYYFGVLGPFGWNDTATYLTVFRKDSIATIIEPEYFHINDSFGGCAEGSIILMADDEGKLYFLNSE